MISRLHGIGVALTIAAITLACGPYDVEEGLVRTVPVFATFDNQCVLRILEDPRKPNQMACRTQGQGFVCRDSTPDREYWVSSAHERSRFVGWGLAPRRHSTQQERHRWAQELDAMYESWRAACPGIAERGSIAERCRGPYCASW